MKVKSIRLIMILSLLIAITPTRVYATSVSVNGPNQMIVGSSSSITISTNDAGGMIQGSIQSSNPSAVSLERGKFLGGDITSNTTTPSDSILVKANAVGTSTITLTGISGRNSNGDKVSLGNQSITITVVPKPEPKPEPKPNTPDKPDKEEQDKQQSIQKTPEQIAAEKKAREEAEKKKAEEQAAAELEEKKKNPMFSEVNIISNSEKMKDETLKVIKTENDTFDYAYTLPKRIDAFKLDLKAIEGATLTYDKVHVIEEGKDSVVVPVKAVSGEVTQDFKITISRNTEKPNIVKSGEKDLEIYDDELLDTAMTSFGFEKQSFDQGDAKIPFFTKGELSIALVRDEGEAVWYSLDKNNKFIDKGVLYLDKENNSLFILEASEEFVSERLYQNSYTEKTYTPNDTLKSVDSTLKFEDTYKSWDYDEKREVVYGFDESGDRDFYVFGDGKIKAAVVAFDSVDQTYKIVSWVLGTILFSIVGTTLLFGIVKVRKKKNHDEYKAETLEELDDAEEDSFEELK